MRIGERCGEFVAMLMISLLTAYFLASQKAMTGFFTSSFGPLEQFLFYFPAVLGISISFVRLVTGLRNVARSIEIVNAAATAAAGFVLFATFPFNFSHLGDLLVNELRFLVNWLPNHIMRDLFLICGFARFANIFYTSYLYMTVKRLVRIEPQPTFEHDVIS